MELGGRSRRCTSTTLSFTWRQSEPERLDSRACFRLKKQKKKKQTTRRTTCIRASTLLVMQRGSVPRRDYPRPSLRARSSPLYAPIDEKTHRSLRRGIYALSKVLAMNGTPVQPGAERRSLAYASRTSLEPADYSPVSAYWGRCHARAWNLWGYVRCT